MGWTEVEKKLLQASNSWFLDEKDPIQWELLIKLIQKEFPHHSTNEIRKVVLHAKQSLLPPVAKNNVIEWLKFAMKDSKNLKAH